MLSKFKWAVSALMVIHVSHDAAFAQDLTGWQNVGKVTRLHPGHGDGVFLFTTETQIKITACAQNDAGYVFPETSAANRNYATLMLAYSLGRPVAIYLTGTCSTTPGRPAVSAVQIHDTAAF